MRMIILNLAFDEIRGSDSEVGPTLCEQRIGKLIRICTVSRSVFSQGACKKSKEELFRETTDWC